MAAPRIDVVDADYCLASWDNIFIQVWRDNPIERRTRAMREAGRRFLASTTGDVGVVVVVQHKCPTPDTVARANTIGFLSDLRERGKAILLAFEGDGFMAAASRAVMVGMMMAARHPMPYKVSRSVQEAEEFMHPLMEQARKRRGELVEAVEYVRSNLPVRPVAGKWLR